jgi:hypothetical protein
MYGPPRDCKGKPDTRRDGLHIWLEIRNALLRAKGERSGQSRWASRPPSIRKQSRISRAGNRHFRRALYMPALVGSRCDPHMKASYESLLARHKTRLQVLVAAARRLIHATYGVLRSKTPYDGRKLFPAFLLESTVSMFLAIKRTISADWSCVYQKL